jgi:hypothetical protein
VSPTGPTAFVLDLGDGTFGGGDAELLAVSHDGFAVGHRGQQLADLPVLLGSTLDQGDPPVLETMG